MNRKFKIGDLVSAENLDNKISKGRITKTWWHHVKVNGFVFLKGDVKHIKYKDQSEPWQESSLRDNDPTIRAVANQLVIMMEK